MIELKDLEDLLIVNEKRMADIEAENRVFKKLIDIEKAKMTTVEEETIVADDQTI